jgi:division protein 1
VSHHYQNALGEIHKELRRPAIQRSLFSLAQTSPVELYRSQLSKQEIQHRAIVSLPDELLHNIPESSSLFSLFQGFQASIPEDDKARKKLKHRGRKRLTDAQKAEKGPAELDDMRNEKRTLTHRLEMLGIRKNMCSSEIMEIDTKMANLAAMRQIVLERLAGLEQEELALDEDLGGLDTKIDMMQEELDEAALLAPPDTIEIVEEEEDAELKKEAEDGFMSESIYGKLPSPKKRRGRVHRRISMPILHEHLQSGSRLKELQAHNDTITAIDFDAPFGTMVTAALDDTVRVWDLNAGRCMGMLEGHKSSVRCLQVDEDIVATGSMDASVRLWDLSKAQYAPKDNRINKSGDATPDEDDGLDFQNEDDELPPPPTTSMEECSLFSLEAHVAEVTALHFRGNTLVSGSADKTIRQWDLEKGRCTQTLDVLWAAAQADATQGTHPPGQWRQKGGRLPDTSSDFIGALQVFDAALACGTADGMVRLWDLRSGQVHRSLVGHTGPISALQFDDVHLVTSSLDRSIRVGHNYPPGI